MAVLLIMMSVTPAFAADTDIAMESSIDESAPSVESNMAQECYYAYTALVEALDSGDIALLNDAIGNMDVIIESDEEFTDEEIAQLEVLFGTGYENVVQEVTDVYVYAIVVVMICDACDEFVANENRDTAEFVVEIYEDIFENPDYYNEHMMVYLRSFVPNIKDIYYRALTVLDISDSADSETSQDAGDSVGVGSVDEEPQKAEKSTKNQQVAKTNSAAVKTGETVIAVAIFAVMMLAFAGVVYYRKRKEN